MAFYVIERRYTGPNLDEHLDAHTYRIQTTPGCGNMSHEPIYNGWLGCTNGWDENACGEFPTMGDAKSAIDAMTDGDYREDEIDRYQDDGILYRVRVGNLQPWTAACSQDWCYESMKDVIAACTPDEEVFSWARDCARDAEDEGGSLDTAAVIDMARKYRDELATAEAEADADADDEYTTEARR